MRQKTIKFIGASALIAYFLTTIVEFYFPNFVAAYFDPAIFLLILCIIFIVLMFWKPKNE